MKYLKIFLHNLLPPSDPRWWGRTCAGMTLYIIGIWVLGYEDQPRIYVGISFLMAALNAWRDCG